MSIVGIGLIQMEDIVSYDPDERKVYFTAKGKTTEIFDEVGEEEFREIEKIEIYTHKCMVIPERLLNILQGGLLSLPSSSERLETLEEDLVEHYNQFPHYKSLAEQSDFRRVRGYSDAVYKVKRPLENAYECIGIVRDFITNSKLIYVCNKGDPDRYQLHHLILNTCAAVEQLGIIAVNRLASESGSIDADSPQQNVSKVYKRIVEENLHDHLDDEEEIEYNIDESDIMRYKEMRDDIAHSSPIRENSTIELPSELSDRVPRYNKSDINELLRISIRLNQLANLVLVRFVHDHSMSGIEPYVAAIYQD